MKIMLTGNKGFIGKSIHYKLYGSHELFCFEKDDMKKENWLDDVKLMVKECDGVMHIGAISDTSSQNVDYIFKYNYLFSKEIIDLGTKYSKPIVFASSASVNGNGGTPLNIYGWSKLLTEQYGLAKGGDFLALRYFNVYGPGEEHKGAMASVAYQAFNKGKFRLFPKKPKRAFIYIKDVVEATIHALFNVRQSGVYDIGYGEAKSFEDVLNYLNLPFVYKSIDSIPPWYQFYTKSNKRFWLPNWKPKYSLKDGISDYMIYLNS